MTMEINTQAEMVLTLLKQAASTYNNGLRSFFASM